MEVKFAPGFKNDMAKLFDWRWAPYRWFKWLMRLPGTLGYYWHRTRHGWAVNDAWGAHYHFTKVAIGMLEWLRDNHCGCPCDLAQQVNGTTDCSQWEVALQKMIDGFKASESISEDPVMPDDPEYARLMKVFEEGMALFTKYYFNLWD